MYAEFTHLLSLFEWSAHNCLLGFSTLVYEFESAPSVEKDPFWSWIQRDPKLRQIFSGVLKHKNINHHGHHDEIALDLLGEPVDLTISDYILASRIHETTVVLKQRNNKNTMSCFLTSQPETRANQIQRPKTNK